MMFSTGDDVLEVVQSTLSVIQRSRDDIERIHDRLAHTLMVIEKGRREAEEVQRLLDSFRQIDSAEARTD
jgi:hypothetical protein